MTYAHSRYPDILEDTRSPTSCSFQDKNRGQIFLGTLETLAPTPDCLMPLAARPPHLSPVLWVIFRKANFLHLSHSVWPVWCSPSHYFCNSSLFVGGGGRGVRMSGRTGPVALTRSPSHPLTRSARSCEPFDPNPHPHDRATHTL